ncbi:hypothetical protein MLD38_010698 [Melastoma candidum]|uniref:Uncharacterized protein n=1 Tax=Melastoma candidum TaxID=119954 RepID=A0ACB9R913_9MYRT|nr:hypothetical protein MLD38_010698 [Melastoma candidum]
MDSKKQEAAWAMGIAEESLQTGNFQQARKMAQKAQQLDSDVDNISQLIMVCDVHCSAEKKFGNELDWYGILQVQQSADETTIRKQYRKFALLLHPDKNKLPGAEAAFKLIGEAQRILLDHASRAAHDRKRNSTLGIPGSQSMPFSRFPGSYRPPHGASWQSNVGVQSHSQSNLTGFSVPPQPPAQAGVFNGQRTFWTICPFCKTKYEYRRNIINMSIICQNCKKVFFAVECHPQVHKSTIPPGASPAAFSPQGPIGTETKVDIGSKSTSPESEKPGSSSKMSKPTAKSRKVNRRTRRQKENSGESHGLDTKSTSDSENESAMCNDSESKGHRVNNKCSSEQAVRRSTRQRQRVSYKETGSDEDDISKTPKKSRGGGEPLHGENGAQEESKLKRENSVGRSFELDPASVPSKLDESILPEDVKPDSDSDPCSDLGDSSSSEDSCVPMSNMSNGCPVPEPEFCNFDDAKSPGNFEIDQIWALYADEDSMPKYYGLITAVTTEPAFEVQLVWLVSKSLPRGAARWHDKKMLISCGRFRVDDSEPVCYNSTDAFSHRLNASTSWEKDGTCNIIPGKGEIWALFRNWSSGIRSSALESCDFDLAEVIETDRSSITVTMLERVSGFSCVCRSRNQGSPRSMVQIPLVEILRFSHQVPAFKLTEEKGGILRGFWEVDPLALPMRFFNPK